MLLIGNGYEGNRSIFRLGRRDPGRVFGRRDRLAQRGLATATLDPGNLCGTRLMPNAGFCGPNSPSNKSSGRPLVGRWLILCRWLLRCKSMTGTSPSLAFYLRESERISLHAIRGLTAQVEKQHAKLADLRVQATPDDPVGSQQYVQLAHASYSNVVLLLCHIDFHLNFGRKVNTDTVTPDDAKKLADGYTREDGNPHPGSEGNRFGGGEGSSLPRGVSVEKQNCVTRGAFLAL